jgi:hypothetical protein
MYIKRLAENFVQKAFLVFEMKSFEVYCRSDSDSLTRQYGSWRLPDSPIWGVGGESTKGKIIALDLYVCLLLQATLVSWNRFLGSLNVSKYGLRLHELAELDPWNGFLSSIT